MIVSTMSSQISAIICGQSHFCYFHHSDVLPETAGILHTSTLSKNFQECLNDEMDEEVKNDLAFCTTFLFQWQYTGWRNKSTPRRNSWCSTSRKCSVSCRNMGTHPAKNAPSMTLQATFQSHSVTVSASRAAFFRTGLRRYEFGGLFAHLCYMLLLRCLYPWMVSLRRRPSHSHHKKSFNDRYLISHGNYSRTELLVCLQLSMTRRQTAGIIQ